MSKNNINIIPYFLLQIVCKVCMDEKTKWMWVPVKRLVATFQGAKSAAVATFQEVKSAMVAIFQEFWYNTQ